MLWVTHNLFIVAAVALVAISATVGVMYAVHQRSADWIDDSRAISRLARTAYVLTVEKELSRRNDPMPRTASERKAAERSDAHFGLVFDSLKLAALPNATRRRRIRGISEAATAWQQSLAVSGGGSRSARRASSTQVQRTRFDILRTRLGLFIAGEELLYTERHHHEQRVRVLTTAMILAEILLLLIVIGGLRRRVVSQATEVLQQKDTLEIQASRLRVTNTELARAIEEKEYARAVAEESASEQAALLTAITEVFFVLGRDGRYYKIAPANDGLLAVPREEMLGKRVHDVLPEPIAALALSAITQALDKGERVDVEYPLDIRGRTIWFAGTVTPLAEDRVLWVVRDVSERKKAAEALKESEARFRNLVEHSPQAVALHAKGRLLYANPTCATLLGFDASHEIIGAPLLRFITPETAPRLLECLASAVTAPTRALTCECQFQRPNDKRIFDVEVTSVPVSYDGRAGILSILHDVTERKQLEDQLAHQAFHDPLTNLANRVLFRDRVEHALKRAEGGSRAPTVLFIDLDNFKAVNDGLGHSAGDWLLIEVASRLAACLRPADTVARLGGDEFAVLLEHETDGSRAVADTIIEAFVRPFSVHGTDIVVTVSIGIASACPREGADEILRNADLALYRAKGAGKACAARFEAAMHVAARRRLETEGELRRAIEGDRSAGELVIYYQPLARLSTGRMTGFEALVRWMHPTRGMLEPLDFISLAEETGLIVPLGRWVLNEACRQTREWQERYGPLHSATGGSLRVGVNLSGRHLSQPELLQDVSAALRNSGLAPTDLVLELTESMLVHDNRATLERLDALKGLGVRLAIDDFGTGYSSLAYLERFPVDSLKMDRSFIAGLGRESSNSPLAEAVIGLGRILGLRVVAEGIETAEQWDVLRRLGCSLGQGFYLSRPVPPADFERLLANPRLVSSRTPPAGTSEVRRRTRRMAS